MIGAAHRVGVVGAAGAVGRELVGLLGERRLAELRLLGRRSREFEHKQVAYRQSPMASGAFEGLDVVLFCASGAAAERYAKEAVMAGALVVDNSSAFRLHEDVPLVVPEVNGAALLQSRSRLIANPNCSTILLLLALAPLHRAFGCRRVDVCTYQAVSGAGSAALEELWAMSTAELTGSDHPPHVFREPVAFNVFSHDSEVDPESGYNGEELKMIREVEKILDNPPPLTATCVRVPVWRSHCEAVSVELERDTSVSDLRDVLETAPGLRLVDERAENRFPTARGAIDQADVLVGRIRRNRSRSAAFHFFLAGDQLLKGAALNALQIADLSLGGEAVGETNGARSRALRTAHHRP